MLDRRRIDEAVRAEKESSKLCALDDDFYQQAHRFLEMLQGELERCESGSSKHRFAQIELENTKKQLEKLFEIRTWKLLKKAVLLRDDEGFDPAILTLEERAVYNDIRRIIRSHQQVLLELSRVGGGAPREEVEAVAVVPERVSVEKKGGEDSEVVKPSAVEERDAGKRNISEEYVVVRVVQDIPLFRGIDMRDYALAKNDVAVLPGANADALCRRKAAIKINIR